MSENLRVRCAAHGRLEAERSFGRDHVERCIDFSRQKRRASTVAEDDVSDTLQRGLTGLGFTRTQARSAVETLRSGRGLVPWRSPIEDLLRGAVQMLSP